MNNDRKVDELLINGNMKITTLSEIKLIRKHLKKQIRHTEGRIENEYFIIASGYRSWIFSYFIQKGFLTVLSFLAKRLFRKRLR